MTIEDLKQSLQPSAEISIHDKQFTVLQHIVWWQAKINETYDKYVLVDEKGNNTFRLSIASGEVWLCTLVHHEFKEPLPKQLSFKGKNYTMTQDEFCIVKKSEGQEFYKVGDAEIWWDYVSNNNESTGLSLGRSWQTWAREDLETKEISLTSINILV